MLSNDKGNLQMIDNMWNRPNDVPTLHNRTFISITIVLIP